VLKHGFHGAEAVKERDGLLKLFVLIYGGFIGFVVAVGFADQFASESAADVGSGAVQVRGGVADIILTDVGEEAAEEGIIHPDVFWDHVFVLHHIVHCEVEEGVFTAQFHGEIGEQVAFGFDIRGNASAAIDDAFIDGVVEQFVGFLLFFLLFGVAHFLALQQLVVQHLMDAAATLDIVVGSGNLDAVAIGEGEELLHTAFAKGGFAHHETFVPILQ